MGLALSAHIDYCVPMTNNEALILQSLPAMLADLAADLDAADRDWSPVPMEYLDVPHEEIMDECRAYAWEQNMDDCERHRIAMGWF